MIRPLDCWRGDPLKNLQLDITHLCNKYCELCDHRIRFDQVYRWMTWEQYNQIVRWAEPTTNIERVSLIGGEPLKHPFFEKLARAVWANFPDAETLLTTNGKLLPKIDPKVLQRFTRIVLSEYPGWNDGIVWEFRKRDNVLIRPLPPGGFWDPYRDPSLNDEEAKRALKLCRYGRDVRIVGTRLYGCRVAEPVERFYVTDSVHTEFDEDWRARWPHLPTWKACAHCFRVIDEIGLENVR